MRKLQRELRVLKGRRIAILGLAFKPGTDDLRDAPALDIAATADRRRLRRVGLRPAVKQLPPELDAVRLTTDAYDAADRTDAVVLATEWPQFRELEPAMLRRVMRGDLVLDGRNFLDEAGFTTAGLRVEGFGW